MDRTGYRVLCILLVLTSGAFLVDSLLVGGGGAAGAEQDRLDVDRADQSTGGVTVVASDLGGYLLAVDADGTVLYRNSSHHSYYDVDPVPGTDRTVVYSAVDKLHANRSTCTPTTYGPRFYDGCTRQVVERANLTTGEVTVLHARTYPTRSGAEVHDVDRAGPGRYLVADMYEDAVYELNVSTGIRTWTWTAQSAFSTATGGPFPADWTHLNDVEALPDGRVLVSVRNQDQVVFVDRDTGVDHDWTLGAEDDHGTLYEQHNPDYIPAERGGPAVLVADSENDRVVEYQREGEAWERTWAWRDGRTGWPRDADRLPNDDTLVTDTHGGRVVQVDPQGEVVWSVEVSSPYEAERLGTGAESTGGTSAARAGLRSVTAATADGANESGGVLDALYPAKLVHGIQYTLALLGVQVAPVDVLALFVLGLSTAGWALLEFRWSPYRVRSPLVRD